MYVFRWFSAALMVLACLASVSPCSVQAQSPATGSTATRGRVNVVLFGHDDRPLAGVRVSVLDVVATTSPSGVANLEAPEGVQTVRLQLDRQLVPQAPIAQGLWVVDMPDVPVVDGEETE